MCCVRPGGVVCWDGMSRRGLCVCVGGAHWWEKAHWYVATCSCLTTNGPPTLVHTSPLHYSSHRRSKDFIALSTEHLCEPPLLILQLQSNAFVKVMIQWHGAKTKTPSNPQNNTSDLTVTAPLPPGSCLWCDSWTAEMLERVRSEMKHFTGLLDFHV